MKYIYYTNKFVIITTAILYLTLYLGLYAQIVLGFVQIISSLLLLFHWKLFSKKSKSRLYCYYTITITYGLCWLFDWPLFNSMLFGIIAIIIIPMSIATYFFITLSNIYKS
ncbi:hypothetical protein RM697_07165 [Ichthyenterobacterium sp. W332]|uniref:Uncharacterized protein n=1 Tax=Microcosmobacter mediterraneus TaxID=3075607 RepID=A0ABU2YL43_9FLAO|nr:hypothetical protein [Ichthyenterobacterium sp. W332]MDT0558419.1 hypothetical protein [Ichthyenterobacterium sp. W332]